MPSWSRDAVACIRVIVTTDFRANKLHRALVAARTRLRDVEERHEHLLEEGVARHHSVGREYAAAVQEYANAVMAWLVALERRAGDGAGDTSVEAAGETAQGA
jgi:hypothetical protein